MALAQGEGIIRASVLSDKDVFLNGQRSIYSDYFETRQRLFKFRGELKAVYHPNSSDSSLPPVLRF